MKTKNIKKNLFKASSAILLVCGAISVAAPVLAGYQECIPGGYKEAETFSTCRKELRPVPGSNETRETVIGNCGSTRYPKDAFCQDTQFEAGCLFSPHDLETPIQSRTGTCREDINGDFSCSNEGKWKGGTKIFVKQCKQGPWDN